MENAEAALEVMILKMGNVKNRVRSKLTHIAHFLMEINVRSVLIGISKMMKVDVKEWILCVKNIKKKLGSVNLALLASKFNLNNVYRMKLFSMMRIVPNGLMGCVLSVQKDHSFMYQENVSKLIPIVGKVMKTMDHAFLVTMVSSYKIKNVLKIRSFLNHIVKDLKKESVWNVHRGITLKEKNVKKSVIFVKLTVQRTASVWVVL